jgi:hypothetical protein
VLERQIDLAALLNRRPDGGPAPRRADLWEGLDRLGRELQTCHGRSEALRLFLRSVQEALAADVVYCCSTADEGPVQSAGPRRLEPGYCRELARQLLSDAPGTDSQLLRSELRPGAAQQLPRSAVMARISRSRSVWAVALSFDPSRPFQADDVRLLSVARRMLVSFQQQHRLQEGLKDSLLGLIHGLTAALDARDPDAAGHSERVARMALRLGQQMGLPPALLSDLYLAGLLHDVGKIGTRDGALERSGPLDEPEREHVREHAELGESIVVGVKQLAHLCPAVRGHHERRLRRADVGPPPPPPPRPRRGHRHPPRRRRRAVGPRGRPQFPRLPARVVRRMP